MRYLALAFIITACGQASDSGTTAPDKAITQPGQNQTLSPEQGPKGDKGDSIVGPQGPKGDPGKTVTGNMWLDPVSNQYWLLGGSGFYADAVKSCSGAWKVPSFDELYLAYSRGLPIQMVPSNPNAPQFYWSSTVVSPNVYKNLKYQIGYNPISVEDQPSVNPAYINCLEVKSQS